MDDTRIVELYWQRSEQAVAETAAKYGSYCFAIADGILHNSADAEECVNDVWIGAWNAMPPHRPEKLSAFLGKIARNLALKRFRAMTAEKRGGGETALALEELESALPGGMSVDGALEERELAAAIDRFLSSLPASQRRIFLCRYWYFDSVQEIARRLGCGESKVKMTCSRTRRKLLLYLKKEGMIV